MARARLTRVVVVVGLLLAAAGVAFVVVVPRLVKARIIAAAAAQGVSLSIDDLGLGFGRARLKGVRAAPLIHADKKGAPTVSATAETIDVELDGLVPNALVITGAHIDIDGSAADVAEALASRDKTAGPGAPTLERITMKECSLVWKHPVGGNLVALRADHVGGDVVHKPGRSLGDDFHFESTEVHAFDNGVARPTPLAPWSLVLDEDANGLRAVLGLGKATTVKLDLAKSGLRALNIDSSRVTPPDVGVPQEALGLWGDDTSALEVHLHYAEKDTQHASGTLVLQASNVFLGASPARTTLSLDARFEGDPTKSVSITQGTLGAGPFTGALTGTFAVGNGLETNLHYESGMVTCADAIKAQAAGFGDVGKGVAALAGFLGLDRAVEGRVRLKGDVVVGTPAANRVSFRTEGDCKLSYLPSP